MRMHKSYLSSRAILAVIACFATGLVLTGCSGKADAPSAPGYYEGPMKAKGSPKLPESKGGGSNAAGQP